MKITQLSAKPELVKITLTDEDIVSKYGDEVDFWVWDRQPLDHYFKMAASGEDNVDKVLEIAKTMILDEDGEPVMKDGMVLPPDVAIKAFNLVLQNLGK